MKATLEMFTDDTLQAITEWLVWGESGPHVCDTEDDSELCKHHMQVELLSALSKIIVAEWENDIVYTLDICTTAIPGICTELF